MLLDEDFFVPALICFRIKVESGADLTSVDRFGNHVEDTRALNTQEGLMSPSYSKLCDVSSDVIYQVPGMVFDFHFHIYRCCDVRAFCFCYILVWRRK